MVKQTGFKLKVSLRPEEWLAIAAALAAFAAVYLFLIHPSLELCAEHQTAAADRRQAEEQLEDARERLRALQTQIAQDRAQLAKLGGSPPLASERDLQIARITAMAKVCSVSVDQYLPIETVDESDHQAAFVQFSGRGDFASIRSYFQHLESGIDFVDVTHFSLMVIDQNNKSSGCNLAWSSRINGMRLARPAEAAPQRAKETMSTEVALREP